ncbi:MAG: hypothetical protein JWO16_1510 [Sphingomonas bacterium]|nr:hypothetical protein [Sphingomonas bacterium]
MMFAKRLRDGVRYGSITCTVRIWQSPRVKIGGRYPIGGGHVVVDSIREITLTDVTDDLARQSGFESVDDLLGTAQHGSGTNVYLIEFHYVPDGG